MEAHEVNKIYMRQYRSRNRDKINAQRRAWNSKNRDKINAQKRAWNSKNRDKIREYQSRYWEKKATTGNIRLPLSAYGITKERYHELLEAARSGQYEEEVILAALKADRQAAEYIILSVVDNVSYDRLEFHTKLGRCSLGRTNFYGVRRLFFYYLDCALKERQNIGTNNVLMYEKM